MKVWILNHYAIPPAYGGLNRHFYFSKNLEKLGVETKIFTASKIHNSEKNFMKNEKGLSKEVIFDGVKYEFVKTGEYSSNGLKRIFSFIQFPFNLLRCLYKFYSLEKPDIIYSSSPELFSTFVAIKFAKKHKLPVLVEIRDLWPESIVAYSSFTEKNIIIKLLYRLEKWIYVNSDIIIFTFKGGKDYIENKRWDIDSGGNINLEKIRYINNGVDIDAFKSHSDFLNDAVLNSDKFKVIYTGSIRRVNSISLVLDACKTLKDLGIDDIDFIIFGNGTEREYLIKKSKDMNLTNIHFRNYVEKKYIPSILDKADATIIVGQHDSMNKYGLSANKIFDYMAAGKPIISNLDVGYDEIIKHECGIVVPQGDGKDIANAVIKLKNLSDYEYNLICKNAKKAASEFDFKKLSKKLFDIFKKIKKG